jgi:dienelactone hydrolase
MYNWEDDMNTNTGHTANRGNTGKQIVLFHSACGLRPAVRELAARLTAAGHQVHTPDLFEGRTFDDVAEGTRYRDSIGIPTLIERAQAAVAKLPADLVYAGQSMGTGPAELLAGTRPGARGAILMHGAFAPADYGIAAWPATVPVQVHHAKADPLIVPDDIAALEASARKAGARAEVHVYQRGGHLFEDPGLPGYDAESARLELDRVLKFLAELPAG